MKNRWSEVTVEEISKKIQYGLTSKSGFTFKGPRYLRITDIQDRSVDWDNVPYSKETQELGKYYLHEGDIVFARTGATVGKSFLIKNITEKAVFASYLIRVVVNKDKILPELLAYYFQTPMYWSSISIKQRGIGQPNVNGKLLGTLRFSMPYDMTVQKKIVDEIETQVTRLDVAIKNLRTIKNRLDIYRKSVLKAVFEGRFMDKFEYETKQLGDFERKGGGTPSTKVKEYWGGKINWITSASIDDRGNISYEKKITELGLKNSATNLVPKGSVIVVTRVGLGKVAVNEEATAFSQDSQGIICKNVNPYFLMWQIKSAANEIISKGQGTTISGITVNKLNEIKVKIPDAKTQTEMVKQIESRCSVIDKLGEVVEASLAKTETLRKSILKSAFEGKLVN